MRDNIFTELADAWDARAGTEQASDRRVLLREVADTLRMTIDANRMVAAQFPPLSPAQVKHMTERFLAWPIPDPEKWQPDGGISVKRPNYAPEVRWMPTGTNLFDYEQASGMVRHMIDGLPRE